MHCEICSKSFKDRRSLAIHLTSQKCMEKQSYYDKYLHDNESKCLYCGSITKFRNITKGYRKFCSVPCRSKFSWLTDNARKEILSHSMKNNNYSEGRPKNSKNKNKYPTTEDVLLRYQNNPPPSWEGKFHSEETKEKMSETASKRIAKNGSPRGGSYKGVFKASHPEKYTGNPHNIIWRSKWELKVMMYFDTSPSIISWQSEEQAIAYRSPADNRIRRYFPDFIITLRDKNGELKTLMIEVKPKSQTVPPKKGKNQKRFLQEVMTYGVNAAKWKAAQFYCKKKGWEFKIFTEDHIFGKHYFGA
tara:strand:+ start:3003 stop:3911 length:909 start_codon:yes stop_codon:yes gene_type:complete